MGLGFLVGLVLAGAFRELLGSGSFSASPVVPFKPLLLVVLPGRRIFHDWP